MSQIKVLLVDDHPVVRSGIRNLLERESDIIVIGEADTGEEALEMADRLSPDVLILDVEIPLMGGVEVARQVINRLQNIHILILSAHDDPSYIQELLTLGVSGYLVKEEALEQIVVAVRGIARGETGWMSRRIAAQIPSWIFRETQESSGLTAREQQVLSRVVAGKTNREIARELGISEKTVEKHLDGIYTKLDVTSRVAAAVRAVQEGLV